MIASLEKTILQVGGCSIDRGDLFNQRDISKIFIIIIVDFDKLLKFGA